MMISGEFHLRLNASELHNQPASWYELVHPADVQRAADKHRVLCTAGTNEKSAILLLRLRSGDGLFLWTHIVMQLKESGESNQPPVIVCTSQVLR
jgi:hypothetical protein